MQNIIKPQNVILVKPLVEGNSFKSVVIDVREKVLVIKIPKNVNGNSFFEDDQIIIGCTEGEMINIFECSIMNINPYKMLLELKINKLRQSEEKRATERFIVSLYADVKIKDKVTLGIVKDISLEGLYFDTKADLKLKQIAEIKIYLEDEPIYMNIQVIRKIESSDLFEYGAIIVFENNILLENQIGRFIKKLESDQRTFINEMITGI